MEAPFEIGKFRVLRLLGQGAMGRVFLAEDSLIDRRVAIKVMSTEGDAEARERFRNEARAVGQLSHRNIVHLYEFGFHHDQPYLVMEYLEGESLDRWIERRPPTESRIAVLLGLCRAVEHAHERGVLHRDIKPSNVQVLPDGTCKLVDFGIARSRSVQLTATGVVLGTPEFIAPEILREAGYSSRSDLYAVALVIYRVLTGKNPFHAQTLEGCLARVMTHQPEPLLVARPDLGPGISEVLEACLRKEPAQRPGDLKPVIDALMRIADSNRFELEQTVRLSEASPREPTLPMASNLPPSRSGSNQPWWRRRQVLVPAVALAVAVLGALVWLAPFEPSPELRSLSQEPPPAVEPTPAGGSEMEPAAPAPASATTGEDGETTRILTRAPDSTDSPATADPPVSTDPPATAAPPASRTDLSEAADAVEIRASEPTVPETVVAKVPTAPELPGPANGDSQQQAKSELDAGARVVPPPSSSQPAAAPPRADLPATAPAAGPQHLADAAEEGLSESGSPATLRTEAPRLVIDRLAPTLIRRGAGATLHLEGTGFDARARVEVRRGKRPMDGIRIRQLKPAGDGAFRIGLFVDNTVPLGLYTVVVLDADGRESNPATLEVGL